MWRQIFAALIIDWEARMRDRFYSTRKQKRPGLFARQCKLSGPLKVAGETSGARARDVFWSTRLPLWHLRDTQQGKAGRSR